MIMGILEMIPPEYWADLKTELNELNALPVASESEEAEPKQTETPEERSKRIRAEYERVIKYRLEEERLLVRTSLRPAVKVNENRRIYETGEREQK